MIYLVFIYLIFILNYQLINCLSCKIIENDIIRDVDYFVAIKIPKLLMDKDLKNQNTGENGYIFKSSIDTDHRFNYRSESIFGVRNSIIQATLSDVYTSYKSFNYIMYNDNIPPNTIPSSLKVGGKKSNIIGQSKGVLIWKEDDPKGIYLVHSAPQFPAPFRSNRYNQDNYAKIAAGNNFMCVTINLDDVNIVIKHLILAKVQVYDKHYVNDERLKAAQAILYGPQPNKNSKMDKNQINFESYNDMKIEGEGLSKKVHIITKSKHERKKLWAKVAFSLDYKKGNFLVKSFPGIFKNKLKHVCEMVVDQQLIIPNGNSQPNGQFRRMHWSSNSDMSKWGVTRAYKNEYGTELHDRKLYCHSDIGLGIKIPIAPSISATALCLEDEKLNKAFLSLNAHSGCKK